MKKKREGAKTASIRIDNDLFLKLREKADKELRTFNAELRLLLTKALDD